MADNMGLWIVLGFMVWTLVGFLGLFFFWRIQNSLARYFSEMEASPWAERASLGWATENPVTPVLGMRRDFARKRLIWRLALWGPPPQLEHSQQARHSLSQYRFLWWFVVCLQLLFVLGASILLSLAFLWLVVIGVAVTMLIVKPSNWPEKPS